jgi:hypothetical protein
VTDGADGRPLIRLYEYTPSDVWRLRDLVSELALGVRQSASLENESWAVFVGGCRLDLRRDSRDTGIRQVGPLRFECALSSSGWSNVEGLLDPFCASEIPGFQWLTHEGRISLLISQNGRC